jgi:tungstate transport system substrate-binding protein
MGRIVALAFFSLLFIGAAQAEDRFITLSSTTSTEDSGLFCHVIPIFRAAKGLDVHVVAVGTGQALALGARGDADALLVHDRAGEDKFVADGYGIDRRDVMYNDFVIVGPKADPAGIRTTKDAREAFLRIANSRTRERPGIATWVKAWGRRSIPRRDSTPIPSPTAPPGPTSRTARTLKS